ncbi:TMF-regulated nuclear protein 1 [Sceloporus undulatus]|uniref:TMF-regulated nuclear protein 1 n=1 Tax=Sceloporus undulatus TaxID=8520 RepID=UPI001C4BB002|nr:TMF-regulated nuclear protein 1 [Sceloporus undulatus]
MTPRQSEAAKQQQQQQQHRPEEEEEDPKSRALAVSPSSPPSSSSRAALELAEARRRLLEAESRRALVSELERRVLHLHGVFLEAELRLAGRAESLGRLAGGVAQAELRLGPGALAALLRRPRSGLPFPKKGALLRRLGASSSCLPCQGPRAPQSPAFARSSRAASSEEPRQGDRQAAGR